MKRLLAGLLLAASALATAAPIPFEVYIKLHNGMPEAELVSQAGAPDYSSDGPTTKTKSETGVTESNTRALSWIANDTIPYTTTVTLRNGVVVDITRDKKL